MIVASCQDVQKYHGANLIFQGVTFEVHEGERVALIGPNGSGKSTLLQLLAGAQRPDQGQITLKKGTRVGYLPQVPTQWDTELVYDVLAQGYREVLACRARIAELEALMAAQNPPPGEQELQRLLAEYARQQEFFQREGGFDMEARIEQVAAGLRIPSEQFGRPYHTLSGGEKTKVGLAALLIARPTLLLLDEPTNHLDLQGIEWLEAFLAEYPGACLVVSHDRYFLDRVVTRVIELEDGEAALYQTHYSGYVREREERLLVQFAQYQEQQKKIKQMQETIRQLLEWGRIGDNEKFFRRAASMQKALDRIERVKRPVLERRTAEFDLQQADRSGVEVVVTDGLSKAYGDRQVLRSVAASLFYGEKVALVGPNGAGKTTLFKLLLGQEQPDSGQVKLGARVEVGYLAQQEAPDSDKSVLQLFCEEARVESGQGRGLLARYLFWGEDVFKPVRLLSGGEWTRLRLALLVQKQPNLLLLDEPTNHLDIASREALEEALEEFPGTVLAISHDRYFMNRLAGRVWELQDGALTSYLGNYDAYREKREELRARAAAATTPPAAPAPKRNRAPEGRSPRAEGPARTKALLEKAIADLEEKLGALEQALEEAQSAGDLGRLSQLWADRERLQAELDGLYEQWLAIEA